MKEYIVTAILKVEEDIYVEADSPEEALRLARGGEGQYSGQPMNASLYDIPNQTPEVNE